MTGRTPRVLVATAVFYQKEYAIRAWLAASRSYTCPHETWLVDNSLDDGEFYARWTRRRPLDPIARAYVSGPAKCKRCGTPLTVRPDYYTQCDQCKTACFYGPYFEPLAQAAEMIRRRVLDEGFDLHDLVMDAYRQSLRAWRARHPEAPAA